MKYLCLAYGDERKYSVMSKAELEEMGTQYYRGRASASRKWLLEAQR